MQDFISSSSEIGIGQVVSYSKRTIMMAILIASFSNLQSTAPKRQSYVYFFQINMKIHFKY